MKYILVVKYILKLTYKVDIYTQNIGSLWTGFYYGLDYYTHNDIEIIDI